MAERGVRPQVPAVQQRALRAVRSLFTPLLPDDYLEMLNPLWSRLKPGPYRGDDIAPRAAKGASPDRPPGVHGSGPEQPTDGVRVRMPHDG